MKARVVESAYTGDLKSPESNLIRVQVPSLAPFIELQQKINNLDSLVHDINYSCIVGKPKTK